MYREYAVRYIHVVRTYLISKILEIHGQACACTYKYVSHVGKRTEAIACRNLMLCTMTGKAPSHTKRIASNFDVECCNPQYPPDAKQGTKDTSDSAM